MFSNYFARTLYRQRTRASSYVADSPFFLLLSSEAVLVPWDEAVFSRSEWSMISCSLCVLLRKAVLFYWLFFSHHSRKNSQRHHVFYCVYDSVVTHTPSSPVTEIKSVCPMHSEDGQAEVLEFGAERAFLQGHVRRQVSCALKSWASWMFQQSLFKGQVRKGLQSYWFRNPCPWRCSP